MSKPRYDFKVSVEGNKLYEIRTSRGLMKKEFLPIIGTEIRILRFCEYVSQNKPLTPGLSKHYSDNAITNTSAEKIAKNLGIPVEYIFPMYSKCKKENEKEKVFATIEERNAAIEKLIPSIGYSIKHNVWSAYTFGMSFEEIKEIATMTLVEVADDVYRRGMKKTQTLAVMH